MQELCLARVYFSRQNRGRGVKLDGSYTPFLGWPQVLAEPSISKTDVIAKLIDVADNSNLLDLISDQIGRSQSQILPKLNRLHLATKDIHDAWGRLSDQSDRAPDFEFFVNFFRDEIHGSHLTASLIDQVASIPDEIWEAGPTKISMQIKLIQGDAEERRVEAFGAGNPNGRSAQGTSVAARIEQNYDAIIFSVMGLLAHLSEYRESVQLMNRLDRDDLLSVVDDLSKKLKELLSMLPSQPETTKSKDQGEYVRWLGDYRSLVLSVAKRYTEPENAAEATVPVGIILGCTGVGALIGGPVGAGAGGVVGGLLSNQMKPGQAAKALLDSASTPPDQ
ncbi:hypothetical protein [Roseobacter sp. A03A-229]